MNSTVKRSIFGVLFLAVMLGGLLFNEILFAILFAFITLVMLGTALGCLIACLAVYERMAWSGYVVIGEAFLYVTLVLPFWSSTTMRAASSNMGSKWFMSTSGLSPPPSPSMATSGSGKGWL